MYNLLALLEHWKLIFANRNSSSAECSDICSLADWIAEESNRDACLKITHLDFRFNCRITLYTCHSNKVHIIESKLCKLRNHGLDKDSGFLRINAACKIIQGDLKDVLANFLRVFSVIC